METQLGFITCLESTAKEQSSQASLTSKTLSQTHYGLPTPHLWVISPCSCPCQETKEFQWRACAPWFLINKCLISSKWAVTMPWSKNYKQLHKLIVNWQPRDSSGYCDNSWGERIFDYGDAEEGDQRVWGKSQAFLAWWRLQNQEAVFVLSLQVFFLKKILNSIFLTWNSLLHRKMVWLVFL